MIQDRDARGKAEPRTRKEISNRVRTIKTTKIDIYYYRRKVKDNEKRHWARSATRAIFLNGFTRGFTL